MKRGFIPTVIFGACSFVYFFRFCDPRLIYQQQQPAYFLGSDFFRTFPAYPGGLADYASAFLSQILASRAWGALVLTGVLLLAVVVSSALFSAITRPARVPVIAFVPALFLLMFHTNYWYPLSISISFLCALSATWLFLRFAPKHFLPRAMIYCLCAAATYWCAAGHALLFAGFCGLHELLIHRKYVSGIAFLIIGAAIPWIACSFFVIIPAYKAFFHQLPFYYNYKPGIAPYLLHAIFPLFITLRVFFPKWLAVFEYDRLPILFRSKATAIIGTSLIVTVLTAMSCALSFDGPKKTCRAMDFYAEHGQWNSLTREMHTIMARPGIARTFSNYSNRQAYPFYVNRALLNKGTLLDSMFAFWQLQPPAGMLVPNDLGERIPAFCSDFYLDLGFVNASQRWAYEAFATTKTPEVLKRLAVACACAGQTKDASRCAALLEKTLFDRAWARGFARTIANDSLLACDPQVRRVRSVMPASDFVMHGIGDDPNLDLATLLKQRPNNRMAFECCMADYLLTYQPDSIIRHIRGFYDLGYSALPRHIQEALAFLQLAVHRSMDLGSFRISDETIERFKDFNRILVAHDRDMALASRELSARFGDTYWFYLYSARPAR
jgi:Family of unknown function (DUF6057)